MLLCNADWVVDVSSWWREMCLDVPRPCHKSRSSTIAAVATVPCQPYEVMRLMSVRTKWTMRCFFTGYKVSRYVTSFIIGGIGSIMPLQSDEHHGIQLVTLCWHATDTPTDITPTCGMGRIQPQRFTKAPRISMLT